MLSNVAISLAQLEADYSSTLLMFLQNLPVWTIDARVCGHGSGGGHSGTRDKNSEPTLYGIAKVGE